MSRGTLSGTGKTWTHCIETYSACEPRPYYERSASCTSDNVMKSAYHGDTRTDLVASRFEALAVQDVWVCGQRDDGARRFMPEDLRERFDRVQPFPGVKLTPRVDVYRTVRTYLK